MKGTSESHGSSSSSRLALETLDQGKLKKSNNRRCAIASNEVLKQVVRQPATCATTEVKDDQPHTELYKKVADEDRLRHQTTVAILPRGFSGAIFGGNGSRRYTVQNLRRKKKNDIPRAQFSSLRTICSK